MQKEVNHGKFSTRWINIYGKNIKIDDALIDRGTSVKALDLKGNLCGEYRVSTPGCFGLMPVYGDDPLTESDEGLLPGEAFTLVFNDFVVPVKLIWTSAGELIDFGEIATTIEADLTAQPEKFSISKNFPNPFNPATPIFYQLPADCQVQLEIYNLLGQRIRTLVAENQKAGFYSVNWNGRDESDRVAASGVYIYKIRAGNFLGINKMLIIK